MLNVLDLGGHFIQNKDGKIPLGCLPYYNREEIEKIIEEHERRRANHDALLERQREESEVARRTADLIAIQRAAQEKGSSVDIKRKAEFKALLDAIKSHDTKEIVRLTNQTPELIAMCVGDETAIHYAADLNNEDMLEFLLKRFKGIDAILDEKGETVLEHTLTKRLPVPVFKILLRHGTCFENPNTKEHIVFKAIQQASSQEKFYPGYLNMLMHVKSDWMRSKKFKEHKGNTALHMVAELKAVNVWRWFMEERMHMGDKNDAGLTPGQLWGNINPTT